MKNLLYFLILSSFLIFACNSSEKGTSENTGDSNTTQTSEEQIKTDRPADSKGKFLVKSALIEFESVMMGMTQNMLMYIDNWGELTRIEMKGEFMGMKTHSVNITKDSVQYIIDMTKKTGQKVKMEKAGTPENIDFTALTDDVIKEFNLKKEGTEEFLGKKCDKYSMSYPKTKMKGTYLVWMGIPLKTDVSVAGLAMTMTAKKIDLDAKISPDLFEVPAGIKITEGLNFQ